MSVKGSILPAEVSASFEETIHHLSSFLMGNKDCQALETSLLEKIELVKDYFRKRGSLTLESTRTIISAQKEEDNAWHADLSLYVFRSHKLPEFAASFLESGRAKEGWIISHFLPHSDELHPHQMPVFVEQNHEGIYCVIFDARRNWDKIRKSLLAAFADNERPIKFYLSEEKRQHDWSTCSILSLDDIRKLNAMDRVNLYSFFEETYSSKEISRNGEWELVVSPHLPARFLDLVQSFDDYRRYRDWAMGSELVDKQALQEVTTRVFSHLVGDEETALNDTILQKYREVITTYIVPKILEGVHPEGCIHS